jgi:hypothetical protein
MEARRQLIKCGLVSLFALVVWLTIAPSGAFARHGVSLHNRLHNGNAPISHCRQPSTAWCNGDGSLRMTERLRPCGREHAARVWRLIAETALKSPRIRLDASSRWIATRHLRIAVWPRRMARVADSETSPFAS